MNTLTKSSIRGFFAGAWAAGFASIALWFFTMAAVTVAALMRGRSIQIPGWHVEVLSGGGFQGALDMRTVLFSTVVLVTVGSVAGVLIGRARARAQGSRRVA